MAYLDLWNIELYEFKATFRSPQLKLKCKKKERLR